MTSPDPDGYLMVFKDGPLAKVGNITTISSVTAGAPFHPGKLVVERGLFGWPLPARLCVLAHPGLAEQVAMWGEGEHTDLPELITDSPNVVTYVKLRESELPDDSDSHIMRGAEYRLA